jgi:hypothetical protein
MTILKSKYQTIVKRWGKGTITLTLTLVLVLVLAGATMALSLEDPTTTWKVIPQVKSFPSDRACPAGTTLFQDQFQSVTQSDVGTYSASTTIDGVLVTVEVTTYPNNSFDFNIINGTTARVFVQGGGDYLLYQYDPPYLSATNEGPVSFDTGLHDGVNPQNQNEYQDVSHIDFCLIPKLFDPPEVTKTAVGSYDRTVTWELAKSVDPDFHSGLAGEIAGTSTWEVVATKSETLGNYKVVGTITIVNKNNSPLEFTIADKLDDGTVAVVDCPSLTVPAGGQVVCTYVASPVDNAATLNTATVSVVGEGDFIATADVLFTENLIGDDEVVVDDDRDTEDQFPETILLSTTFDYDEEFVCSSNPADYTDGKRTDIYPNTATLTGENTSLEASAEVKVVCELPELNVAKTAEGSFDRTVTWELEKSVDPDFHSGLAGEIAGTSTWEVVATKSETLGNYKVVGTITIINPAAIPQTFTVADKLDDGTVAVVDCPSLTVPAGGQVVCTYVASPVDNAATLNTATVTAVGNPAQFATADVLFTENLIGDDEVVVDDDRDTEDQFPETILLSTTFDYDEEFVCSSNPADYTDGKRTDIYPNTATLTGENTSLEASAEVKVVCELPELNVAKTAEGSFDRTVTWELEKSVDPDFHSGLAGEIAGTSTWEVVATKSETLGNYKVVGTITIINPAAIPQTFTVADKLDDGTVAVVDCPSLTVPADGQVVCTYVASTSDDSATLNTATVTAVGNPAQVATAPVTFIEILVGYDEGTLSDPRFDFEQLISDSTTKTFDEDFVCPPADSVDYVDGIYEFEVVNTAFLNGNIKLQASATVTVTCYLPAQRPSIAILGGELTVDSPYNPFKGVFYIQNKSADDDPNPSTWVTLGTTTTFLKARVRGRLVDLATCTNNATGQVLKPFPYIGTFTFDCGTVKNLEKYSEVYLEIYVDGATTTNQFGENREGMTWFYSQEFKLVFDNGDGGGDGGGKNPRKP